MGYIAPVARLGLELELAWAAGFFDGEGSTGAGLDRPSGSVRIFASVPQASASAEGAPVVLRRFHRAVGSLGRVGSPHLDRRSGTHLYQWRTDNFEEVQAVVALLWSHLGPVKRAQAQRALTRFGVRYATVASPRTRRPEVPRRLIGRPPEHGARGETRLAWAAGLFEAEGSTEAQLRRAGDRTYFGIRAKVSQCDSRGVPDVLRRFRDAMSCGWIEGPASGAGYVNAYKWAAGAEDTLASLEVLWPYLGPVKRGQALEALARVAASFVTRRHAWRDAADEFAATHSVEESQTTYGLGGAAA